MILNNFQISTDLLRILVDFSSLVVWMVAILFLISITLCLFQVLGYYFKGSLYDWNHHRYYYYYYYYYYFTLCDLFTAALADGLSLSSEWQQIPQISRTLLSILADHNNSVVEVDSILPLIFSSCCLFSKAVGTGFSVPTIIGITDTMFLYFFSTFARS